jgi:pilus assembly protein CpaE
MRVLLIDDELYYFKLLDKPLKSAGYELEYSKTAKEALAVIASQDLDIVIVDLMLPDMSGFDILERLRRDQRFGHIPVVVITSNNKLDDKLKAFEAGADDYLVKPFQPEELVARLRILANRGKALKIVQQMETQSENISTIVAVHSLRGGVGCTSLAVNLAIAYYQLWQKRTLLVDAVLTAGQVAMMLDATPRITWEHYLGIAPNSIAGEDVEQLSHPHKSGISFIASPKTPMAVDAFTDEFWRVMLAEFKKRNEFIVVDLAHDFSDMTIQILNQADWILLVLAPEIASLRAAASTLEIYDKLGFTPDKVKVVLNQTSNNSGIKQAKLEKALERQFDFVIPYEPTEVMRALNFGIPFITENTDLPISIQLENMAYTLSHEFFKNLPPAVPTPTWKRVTERLTVNK